LIHRRDDVRHQHPRAQAVRVGMAHVAADAVEKAVHLALRVVETACAGPAIGAAENGAIAVLLAHACQFASHQVEGLVPLHLDKRILSAQVACRLRQVTAPCLQPAATDGRPAHPQWSACRIEHGQADGEGEGSRANGRRPRVSPVPVAS
jgi:hypothetical protein